MIDRVSERMDIGSWQARDYARIFDSRIVGSYARFIGENQRADNYIFNNAKSNLCDIEMELRAQHALDHYQPRDQEPPFLHDEFNTMHNIWPKSIHDWLVQNTQDYFVFDVVNAMRLECSSEDMRGAHFHLAKKKEARINFVECLSMNIKDRAMRREAIRLVKDVQNNLNLEIFYEDRCHPYPGKRDHRALSMAYFEALCYLCDSTIQSAGAGQVQSRSYGDNVMLSRFSGPHRLQVSIFTIYTIL